MVYLTLAAHVSISSFCILQLVWFNKVFLYTLPNSGLCFDENSHISLKLPRTKKKQILYTYSFKNEVQINVLKVQF